MKKSFQILIVDDEPLIRESLYEILRIEGYRVQMADSAEKALQMIEEHEFDVIVSDFKLPRMNGIELLEKVKSRSVKTEVILITGFGSIETAVDAMRKGAYDYITKPINDSEIKHIIYKIVEKRQILDENESLKEQIAQGSRITFSGMIGSSSVMQNVYNMIEAVASSNATILISGESGTGKGLIARSIHTNDKQRKDKPFIEVSCGALTETLLESELFGHIKGAFTGAIKDKKGRFEYADGGTVFLDEIDTLSMNLQVKLLRVLQDGVFERVGDNTTLQSNARIIVATNQDLNELVDRGEFREDLFYRVNVICIEPPPLRKRKEDLELLIRHFVSLYADSNQKKIKEVKDDVVEMFKSYDWPGNVREFENAIEGAVIMSQDGVIKVDDIPSKAKFMKSDKGSSPKSDAERGAAGNSTILKKAVEEPEREHIISVLKGFGWNRIKAAEALGINRTTLYNKMKKYKIVES